MPYTQQELGRIVEIFTAVENNKEHENAAPTYKDSPLLEEMAAIVLNRKDSDKGALEEKVPALWYLTECYDAMGRTGVSVKLYLPQLEAHVSLMKLREYSDEDMRRFESCFYLAVKARNYYGQDDCEDLKRIVAGSLSEEKIDSLFCSACESRRDGIKNDPIESTQEYLSVIDEVERKIDESKTMDFCHEFWSLKAGYLREYGIQWESPAQLNPGVLFD